MNSIKYYNYLSSFDYYNKLPIYSNKVLPKLQKATVSLRLKVISEFDLRIPHALLFSDWLTSQRGFIKSMKFIYKYNRPIIQIIILTTLHKKALFSLFEYIITCYFDLLDKKLSTTRVSIFSNGFRFFLKDINFFYNVPNILYNFNDTIEIKFFITSINNSKNLIKLFLSRYPSLYKYLL